MDQNRKQVDNLLSKITNLQQQCEYFEKDMIRLSSQSEYKQVVKYFEQLIAKLTKELLAMPIGYRYTGTFYLKKPYSFPVIFEKYEGTLFMRAGLVSWQTEPGSQPSNTNYYRQAFKQPTNDAEITRADTVPVYATNSKNLWQEF